jgi:hypothetical protein
MGTYGDRDDFSWSREINMRAIREALVKPSWRQRMVQQEKERRAAQKEVKGKDSTNFPKDSSFKIKRG